jgi:hypothetical protein
MLATCDDVDVPGAPVALGRGWLVSFHPSDRGARLRLRHPRQRPVDVEIVLGADGPVVRAAAAALEITATDEISARCRRFSVDAAGSFAVRAADVALTARSGGVAIRANDDVAVNGEQVLLNCDRDPPAPSWLPSPGEG